MRYEVLDIEHPPADQGFAGRPFDVVIAANVLHATRDLRQALRHVRQLLRPGGLLLLLEITAPVKWIDLVWGLTPGWWRFDDDLRPSYPLLPATRWHQLLVEMGFASAESLSVDPGRHEALSRQALVVAQNAEGSPTAAPDAGGTWLILADAGGLGEELATLLAASGDRCVLVHPANGFARRSDDAFKIDPAAPHDYRRLLDHLADAGGPPLRGVVHLWSLDALPTDRLTAAALATEAPGLAGSVLSLVQALTAARLPRPPRLWLVSRAAQPVGDDGRHLELVAATVWGLGKVIALEHPEIWAGCSTWTPGRRPTTRPRCGRFFPASMRKITWPFAGDGISSRG